MSFWVNVKWLSNGYNLNGTTLVRNFCHSPFTFVLCSHRELWVALSFILYSQIKFLIHDSLSIIKLIKKWRKNNFFGKLKRWNLFWLQPIFNSRPKCSHVIWLPTFFLHSFLRACPDKPRGSQSLKDTEREREREREREMEPPPPQSIETSSKDFQAGQDEQDKVVDEW